jgi:hypothetical protein
VVGQEVNVNRRSAWEPTTEPEVALYDALLVGDQERYFRILAKIELLLPISADAAAGRSPMGWATWTSNDHTHLLAFTSLHSMRTCLAEHAGAARRMPVADLADVWPNQDWWLAVNPGLPVEGYLPPWFVAQLARGDARLPNQLTSGPRDRLERVQALERAKAARAAGGYQQRDTLRVHATVNQRALPTSNPPHPLDPVHPWLDEPLPRRMAADDEAHPWLDAEVTSVRQIDEPQRAAASAGRPGDPYPLPRRARQEEAGAWPGATRSAEEAARIQSAHDRAVDELAAVWPSGLGRREADSAPAWSASGTANASTTTARGTGTEAASGPSASRLSASAAFAGAASGRAAASTAGGAGFADAASKGPSGRAAAGGTAYAEPPPGRAASVDPLSSRGGSSGTAYAEAFDDSYPPAAYEPSSYRSSGSPAWSVPPPEPYEPTPWPSASREAPPEPREAEAKGVNGHAPERTDRPRHAEPEPAFIPANQVEADLFEAAEAGNTDSFLSTLLLATVYIPKGTGTENGKWRPQPIDGEPHLICYTSSQHLPEGLELVSVRFIKLIMDWPDPGWSFAVNPGSPVGATLPGGQLLALASWAKEVGLARDDDAEDEPEKVERAGAVPGRAKTELTMLQKAVAPSQVNYYLDRVYDRVSGFVHRAHEVGHLRDAQQMRRALGLDYEGSPFLETDKDIYLLRWSAYRPNLYRIPYGGQTEAAMKAMQGWVIERAPFRGNGFAPGESKAIIAEFKVDSARLPHGTQLIKLRDDGQEIITAVLDADNQRWVRGSGGGRA